MATRTVNALRRFAIVAAILTAGLTTVVLLAPGGLGTPAPARVTEGVSAEIYRAVAGWTDGGPEWVRKLAELGGEASLIVLGLLLVSIWWTGRRGASGQVAIAGLTAAGTVAAYLVSEAVKLVVDEERPCRVLGSSEVACPPVGDWSFPSNHATLAAALAVGLALARPRLAALALSLAGIAAAARVLAGVTTARCAGRPGAQSSRRWSSDAAARRPADREGGPDTGGRVAG